MAARFWVMWLFASLFYAYQYILRVIPNVLKTDIDASFHVDPLLFGQFASVYYIGYTLAHIPLGIALDRYGPKWVLPLATLLCSIGMTPLLFADSFLYPIIGRFFLGIGSSCAFIGLVKVVSIAFEREKFHKMLSFGSIFGLIGGFFAVAPVHYLMGYFGWKTIVLISFLIGVLLSVLLFLAIPAVQKSNEYTSPFKTIKLIFLNKWVWLVAIAAGLMVGPMEGFADAWAVQSLKSLYNVTDEFASQNVSLIYFGFAIGLPGLSFLSDRIGFDKTIILSGVSMIVLFLLIMSGILTNWLLVCSFICLGFFCAYQVPALCRATTFTPVFATSLTTAVANMVIMLFGSFFHTILGGCVSYFSTAPIAEKNIIGCYTPLIYQKSFMVIPFMLIFGIIIFFYVHLKNRNPIS
jgi:MFS family permease